MINDSQDLILINPQRYENSNILLKDNKFLVSFDDYKSYQILFEKYSFHFKTLLKASPLITQHLNSVYLTDNSQISFQTNYNFDLDNDNELKLRVTQESSRDHSSSLKEYIISLKANEVKTFLLSIILNYNYQDTIEIRVL